MFKDELDNRLLYINSVIKEFLPESDNELYKKIIDAACYSVEAGKSWPIAWIGESIEKSG